MKCKREECQVDVPEKLQRVGHVYCSRDCAPFGNLGFSSVTSSAPKRETFYSKAAGIQSAKLEKESASNVGQQQTLKIVCPPRLSQGTSPQNSSKKEESKSVSTTNETKSESTATQSYGVQVGPTSSEEQTHKETGPQKSETSNDTERFGRNGMTGTERNIVEMKSQDATEETSREQSVEPVKNLDSERSATMSLIDESAGLLRDCMKVQVKKRDLERPLDFREVHAIANLGKQIASLAKVKLDAIKEARK